MTAKKTNTRKNADQMMERMRNNFKRICAEKHTTASAIAAKAGISTSTVSYILNGKTHPQIYTVLQLCDELDIDIRELFAETDAGVTEVSRLTEDEKKLLNAYRRMSENQKSQMNVCVELVERTGK